jgi:four helix bundle protein
MSKITRFEDLECWQEARKLVQEVYKICRNPNFNRDFRLIGQIQGAAISAMANIPEGFIRKSTKEFIQFLFISQSSAAEVQSHLYVALDQEYITMEEFERVFNQANKTAMITTGLIKYLRKISTKKG